MTYALIACLLDCYVVDFNLTYDDCARRARLGIVSLWLDRDTRVSAAGYRLKCELDD